MGVGDSGVSLLLCLTRQWDNQPVLDTHIFETEMQRPGQVAAVNVLCDARPSTTLSESLSESRERENIFKRSHHLRETSFQAGTRLLTSKINHLLFIQISQFLKRGNFPKSSPLFFFKAV